MPHKGYINYSAIESSKMISIHGPDQEDRYKDGCIFLPLLSRHCTPKLEGEFWVGKELTIGHRWISLSSQHVDTKDEVSIDHQDVRNETALLIDFGSDGYYCPDGNGSVFLKSGREAEKNRVAYADYLRFHRHG